MQAMLLETTGKGRNRHFTLRRGPEGSARYTRGESDFRSRIKSRFKELHAVVGDELAVVPGAVLASGGPDLLH